MDFLKDHEMVIEMLRLMEENNRQDQAKDFSRLIACVDSMEQQYAAVLSELQDVKQRLAEMPEQRRSVKDALTDMAQTLENRVEEMREQLQTIREKIISWKAWSDESYHQIENAEIAFSKHILSLHGLSEKATAVQSPEDTLMETLEQQEREEMRRLLMDGLDNCLTRPQRRRLWLYYVDGLTVRQIAEAEGVQHPSIVECLAAAKKKLLAFLKNMA